MFHIKVSHSTVEVTWRYLVLAIFFGLVIRLILCGFREWEQRSDPFKRTRLPASWWRSLGQAFFCTRQSSIRDYWLNFSVGLLELLAYPYFIAQGNLKVIGGWLALKTVAQWKGWAADSRGPYQRFLLGNALVVAFSVLLAQMLQITPS
jgi:hypothetical protein